MEKTNGGNLIQIKNLVATVNLNNGDTLVTVNKANMELKRGNSYAIVGKSGSGKTTRQKIPLRSLGKATRPLTLTRRNR